MSADMSEERSRPLVPLTAIWEKNSVSRYPETIRIPMDDGHVIKYKLDEPELPHPCFLKAIDLVRSMKEGGYQDKKSRWL